MYIIVLNTNLGLNLYKLQYYNTENSTIFVKKQMTPNKDLKQSEPQVGLWPNYCLYSVTLRRENQRHEVIVCK